MEENRELLALVEQMERMQEKQTRFARLQCLLTGGAAVCCVALVLLVGSLMPQVRALTGQMAEVLGNLKIVTDQLAAADLEGMVENVDTLAATSRDAVEQAVGKLNAINIATLNRAIENLADVVEPLARFFNVFS